MNWPTIWRMHDQVTPVVVDTTPIIALALLGQLDLLQQLYAEVTIPSAVRAELLAGGGTAAGFTDFQRASWIRTITLQDPRRADLLADLDRGEAEVLALAEEVRARLVIIDERLARRHARHLGLTLTGTVGVLLKAKQQGLIPEVSSLLAQLRSRGIRLSDALVQEALRLADEV